MKRSATPQRGHTWLTLGCLGLTLLLVSACGRAEPLAGTPTSGAVGTLVSVPTAPHAASTWITVRAPNTVTRIPSVRPTSAKEATRAARLTAVAQLAAAQRTQYALSPSPLPPTPITPRPTPTWVMGLQGCTNFPGYYPQMFGCWRGYFNGELIGVSGGRQGTESDRRQGLLMIFRDGLFNPTAASTEVYSTPVKIGGVRLVSVDGNLATLISYDFPWILYTPTPVVSPTPGAMFVFDLANRRWLSWPAPIPEPSATP